MAHPLASEYSVAMHLSFRYHATQAHPKAFTDNQDA